jgi:hypothetical protein
MMAESPTKEGKRKDTHEVGPRRAASSARFAPYSDMTGPQAVSLLPGAGMGMDWMDCSGSRNQASFSGDGAGIAELLGTGTD